jgi:hypothetical protein
MRHLLLVELNADNHFQKKPFNFMQWALGHLGHPRGHPGFSISHSFIDILLISRYVTHFSISLHRGFAPGWTEGVSQGVWEIVVAGCLGDSGGRVSGRD